jgi:hypothetical protein
MPHGIHPMAYVGKEPWHGLSTQLRVLRLRATQQVGPFSSGLIR